MCLVCVQLFRTFLGCILFHQVIRLGFTNIDALEPCEALAKKALEKNIYKRWYKAYMCKDRLPIDDGKYTHRTEKLSLLLQDAVKAIVYCVVQTVI